MGDLKQMTGAVGPACGGVRCKVRYQAESRRTCEIERGWKCVDDKS
ncbi:hypothetical protein ANAPC5_01317 [Anaplasma phagocytophilum]|nr:hypothetical protein ANAPC5_01317 [Anaplasma phagocytophilum]